MSRVPQYGRPVDDDDDEPDVTYRRDARGFWSWTLYATDGAVRLARGGFETRAAAEADVRRCLPETVRRASF